jgi:hypothetical protein
MKRIAFVLIGLFTACGSVMASENCAQQAVDAANDFMQDGRCGLATLDDVSQIAEEDYVVTLCKDTRHVVDIKVTTDSDQACTVKNVERTN